MSRNPMSKLSASFLVLVMALAALVVLPGPNQGQALGTNDIYVPVVSGGIPVSGATVTLTNVHTGEVIQATPSGGLYRAAAAPSGYYRVDVVAGAYYDAVDVRGFQFLGTASYTVSPQIQLTKFPTASYSWNVTVVTAAAPHSPILGARVSFYDDAAHEKVATDTGATGVQGYTTVVMFPTSSPNMFLTVEADGFETNATAQTVSGSQSITVWLEQAGVISGLVTNQDGSQPATSGVVAYALDSDTSLPWVKRLLKSEGLSPYFVFNGKVGNTYTICVDAPGLAANVSQIVSTSEIQYLTMMLADQTQRTEQVQMVLAGGYGSFSYSLATVLSYDDAIQGMNYSDIGSLRMQIDLSGFGVADNDLSLTEIGKFGAKLTGYGVAHPTSGRLLTINNTLYSSDAPVFGSLSGLAIGSVISTDGISYSYTSTYTALDSIDASAPDYMMNATAMLDSPAVHHVNNITLPGLYEAVQNSTSGHVNVTGYHPWVVLSSEEGSSVTELVHVWIEKSEKPTVKGGIDTTHTGAYAVKVNNTVTKYIVKVGSNITFDATESIDPNGNPLTYIWDFTDGTTVTTSNMTVVHIFATASDLRQVVLNVTDVSGLWNETQINVTCDGLDPAPVISFLNKTVNTTDNSITVNQREGFVFNATASVDDVAVGDPHDELGIIDYVEFDYGDGNKSGRLPWTQAEQNASHSYASAGDFNLTLNVTDVVGHWKNTTIVVHVNDTTDPTISYTVKNATGGTNLVENKTIVFDANLTADNINNVSLMHFSWYFGDGTWLNGTGAEGMLNVTHVYTRIGPITVSLNVTDLSGNYLQAPKQITITSGPRPTVRIDRVYYEPGNFTEGQSGYIIVNMTNTGSAAANGVVLSLYLVNSDGSEKLLTTWDTLLNGSLEVDVIEIGGKVQAKIPWTFDNKGTYTFKLNVTSENQLSPGKYTASGDLALHVKEAGWKKLLLWGGVAAVIILVPLAIYLSRRWSKREKKGPRREKKVVEKEKDEDL
jgi:hypothetical protein